MRQFCALTKAQSSRHTWSSFVALAIGVVKQYSTAHLPGQNGRAERLNRTFAETTHALLIEHQEQKRLWPDAICTVKYPRKRIPTSTQDE
jgi:hypothetical protein